MKVDTLKKYLDFRKYFQNLGDFANPSKIYESGTVFLNDIEINFSYGTINTSEIESDLKPEPILEGGVTIENFTKSVVPIIESVYATLTSAEKIIADFFISNTDEDCDFSAKGIAELLHVSEASLTRFSKKCGYTGYREFIYVYKSNFLEEADDYHELTRQVLADYDEILSKTYSLIDEQQIERVVEMIVASKRVVFYGIGSSGLVAQEMKSRFMRLGLHCDAFTDHDHIRMSSVLLDEDSVAIGLSVSSETSVINSSLERGHKNGAKTILFTANLKNDMETFCDEIVLVAISRNLNYGNRISPQLPLLVMVDIFYSYYSNSDHTSRKEVFSSTVQALEEEFG